VKRLALLLLVVFVQIGCSVSDHGPLGVLLPFTVPEGGIQLVFSVTADMRDFSGDNPDYFRGACERIASGGAGSFMISVGDIDPPDMVYGTIGDYIDGSYIWYPVVGNHEAETSSDMQWLRNFNAGGSSLPNVVRNGPANCLETTYSFDYGEVHFVVLNEYFDGASDVGTDGDVSDALHSWLTDDLDANTKPIVLVLGHEPAYPLPDADSGRLRHETDSLNAHVTNRDRFWTTLSSHSVAAYICGHTHNYSVEKLDGVWQVDAGHARGTGDTGSRSTFLMFYIMSNGDVWYYTYRLNPESSQYELGYTGRLD